MIPGSGRSPGEGYSNPLQYCCLENPMDRGAWWASLWGCKESDITEHTQRYLHDILSPCIISDRKPRHPAFHSFLFSSPCHLGFARTFP